MPVPTLLHICCGDSAAALIRAALPGAAVLTLRDDLAVGPLADVDGAATARVAFWAEVMPPPDLRAIEAEGPLAGQLAAEAQALRNLPQAAQSVVVWHGTGAAERLMLCRVLRALQGSGIPVAEVAVGPGSLPDAGRTDMTAVAMLAPDAVPALAAAARPVPPDRRDRLARDWDRLRADGSGLRHAVGDTITGAPIDAHDGEILAAVGPDWQRTARAVGRPMGEITGFFATDSFVFWRLRRLAAQGLVEFRGDADSMRGCDIRRAA